MKKIFLLISLFIFTFCLYGCTVKTETFTGGGISVDLTSDFEEYESENWTFYVENDDIAVMCNSFNKQSSIGNEQKFPLGTLTLENFMDVMLAIYGIEATTYLVEGVNETFYYCYYTVNSKYGYMMLVLEDFNYFYVVALSCSYKDFQTTKPLLFNYAASIKVLSNN